MAVTASMSILNHQDMHAHPGGIYQSDIHTLIIPYYTARCIPVLIELFKLTKDERYVDSARAAVSYIQKHRLENGFFSFGDCLDEKKNRRAPIFLAGAGDVGRAFDVMADYQSISSKSVVRALLSVQRENGAFPAKWERVPGVGRTIHSWKDQSLRFLSEHLEKGEQLSEDDFSFPTTNETCAEGTFTETKEEIRVEGMETYSWNKTESFSRPRSPLKPLWYHLGNTGLPILKTVGSRVWKMM